MRLRETIRNAGGELDRNQPEVDSNAYGYLFRDLRLNPWRPSGPSDPKQQLEKIFELSKGLVGPSGPNKKIPAGYAFFGQFITHDLTFAVTPFDRRLNRRTPRFDLDSVYAGGPETHPYLYELRDPDRLLVGTNEFGEPDLPRNADTSLRKGATDTFTRRRSALIGDPRNDENVIVSQLHLAILRLHNRLLDRGFDFHKAQRVARWSYQHAVIDFLRRVCGPEIVDEVMGKDGKPNLKYFKITPERVYMPIEFSFAAFRFGHTMLGDSYHLNDHLERERKGEKFQLFGDVSTEWSDRNQVAQHTLEGQRELPEKWTIQWNRFIGDSNRAQPSQLIDRQLAPSLLHLPVDVSRDATDDRERSLAYRTLLRGWLQRLPSGQKVAELMGEKVLTPVAEDPLWVYVLREAEDAKDEEGIGGTRLGPVGARIVTEVCVGLLKADSDDSGSDTGSYYARQPSWTPWKDLGLRGSGPFGLEHLLIAAAMPMSRADWNDWIRDNAR